MKYEDLGSDTYLFTFGVEDFQDSNIFYGLIDNTLSEAEMRDATMPLLQDAMAELIENDEISGDAHSVAAEVCVRPAEEKLLIKLHCLNINPLDAILDSLLGNSIDKEVLENIRNGSFIESDEVVESDVYDAEVDNSNEISSDESKEVYYLFDSMSRVIDFCMNIGDSDLISSSLFKMTGNKSPLLRDKYVLQLGLNADVDVFKYTEFAQFIPRDLSFNPLMLEHAETVIGVDAVSKLKLVA